MSLTLSFAGALALCVPTLVSTPAFAQGWPGAPYEAPPRETAPRGYTELRVAPPPGGQVYVYEGHRLLGRFDRPGSMLAATGRSYRVIAMRGDTQIWAGSITAAGAPVDLDWAALPRAREPMAPPPPAVPPPYPYEAPQRYEEAPPYAESRYRAPVMTSAELRGLLREMDRSPDDQDRLEALAAASERHSFAVPQADWILGRFRSEAYRLAALERMRDRLIGREDAGLLLHRFRNPPARAQAAQMLGW